MSEQKVVKACSPAQTGGAAARVAWRTMYLSGGVILLIIIIIVVVLLMRR